MAYDRNVGLSRERVGIVRPEDLRRWRCLLPIRQLEERRGVPGKARILAVGDEDHNRVLRYDRYVKLNRLWSSGALHDDLSGKV